MRRNLFLFVCFILGILPLLGSAQPINVSGKITDKSGLPLPGVTVVVKGTTSGTISGSDGSYLMSNVQGNSTLVFSFVGMQSQEIAVGGRPVINVSLDEETIGIEEVVAVGYATQKKVNLTGSVVAVDMTDVVESRPITSLSSGLSGLAAGLYVNQGTGRPGSDGATLRIRGQGTLNNSNPLVIIDGVVGNMNDLNPQDVESISVLKDAASSAIYGSRAANGVILITTRKGKEGTMRVNYSSYLSMVQPSNMIESVTNYADYMELINEGYNNTDPNAAKKFTQATIDLWRANEGLDPLKYPNADWTEEVFQQSLNQNHNVSMSGGTDKIRFFGSFGYLDNPGIIEQSGYERYTARVNLDADVKPWLNLGMNVNGMYARTDIGTNALNDLFTYASASTPGMVLRAPDGRYGSVNNSEDDPQSNNVLHRLNNTKGDIKQNRVTARFFGKFMPVKGLAIEGSYNVDFWDQFRYQQPVFLDRWNFLTNSIASAGTGRTSVANQNDKRNQYFMDGVIRYENKVLDKLSYNVMAGASQEYYKEHWFSASKMDLVDPSLSVLNAATMDAAASGNATDWTMQSYFGRLNMNWDEKYLFEANLRYDGSSRFMTGDTRWGVFPSFSAGWRINQEGFMSDITWIDNLKARASWGALGNNAVGNYEYQAVYATANYILNNNLNVGFAQKALSNSFLTWESTYVSNLGVDFDMFKSRLSGSVDLFDKTTRNILIDLPAPLVVGNASIPKQNAAEVRNRGFEINLGWRNKVGELGYQVNGNFTYIDNLVTKFKGDERTISGSNLLQEGYPINVQYVLAVDRILQTEADMALVQALKDNAPVDPVSGQKRNPFAAYGEPKLGDFLYKDMNGDGIINDDDRYTVGNGTAPRVTYGLNLGLDWKGIDFSVFLQGNQGLKVFWLDDYYRPVVRWGYHVNAEIADGRWYPGRTDATYPRLLEYAQTRNTRASDFWVQDKSYLRIKNIQLGYTVPKNLTEKISIEGLRVYGSLENYLTFTKYKGFDPEVSGANYPTMKQALLGISVTF
jgi:TonB-dependent starch-binding outer membrane protein SusC